LTSNLSGVVEALLTEFVERKQHRRRERADQSVRTVTRWNAFEGIGVILYSSHRSIAEPSLNVMHLPFSSPA
jgi:hypothetical protein